MLDCILVDGRKGRSSYYSGKQGSDEDCSDNLRSKVSPREMSPCSDVELPRAGVRRDRTTQLVKLRTMASERRRLDSSRSSRSEIPSQGDAKRSLSLRALDEVDTQLRSIFESASRVHTSLASKLAQHNGLCQFGASFRNRAPPLELRMIVPELEASIEELLTSLQSSLDSLGALSVPPGSRNETVRSRLDEYVRLAQDSAKTAYQEQREHLKILAAASPLYSPTLDPTLSMSMSRRLSENSTAADVHSNAASPTAALALPKSQWDFRAGSQSNSRSSSCSRTDTSDTPNDVANKLSEDTSDYEGILKMDMTMCIIEPGPLGSSRIL
mmetsp:Transcript_44527/g.105523  ORF Transcript_44527/g.105523 Transcript_44527/m.105523 type:complete len:327 (-) Transcript_44527:10-990(-)